MPTMSPAAARYGNTIPMSSPNETLFSISLADVDATLEAGRALGEVAEAGLVVGLVGDLGAGKTTFVRGVAVGLDVDDPRSVSSPTYMLIQEYSGRCPIYHIDTYRLAQPREFAGLGVEEYLDGEGVCLVEWADRVLDQLPRDRVDIQFDVDRGPNGPRRLTARCQGRRWMDLFSRWRDQLGRS